MVAFSRTVYRVSYAFFESISSACFQNLGLLLLIYQLFIASIKLGTAWQAAEISYFSKLDSIFSINSLVYNKAYISNGLSEE